MTLRTPIFKNLLKNRVLSEKNIYVKLLSFQPVNFIYLFIF